MRVSLLLVIAQLCAVAVFFCALEAKPNRSYIFTKISDTEGTVTCVGPTKPHMRMLAPNTLAVRCFDDTQK